MNHCSSNTSIDTLGAKEALPFALEENCAVGEQYNRDNSDTLPCESSCPVPNHPETRNETADKACPQSHPIHPQAYSSIITDQSIDSEPPGLMESAMTDGTSFCSTEVASNNSALSVSVDGQNKQSTHRNPSQISSVMSTSSLRTIPLYQSEYGHSLSDRGSLRRPLSSLVDQRQQAQKLEGSSRSFGFSELLNAADDSNIELGESTECMTTQLPERKPCARLSPLIESQELESGALISPAPHCESGTPGTTGPRRMRSIEKKSWRGVSFLGTQPTRTNRELETPLLPTAEEGDMHLRTSSPSNVTRLLSHDSTQQHHANGALSRAIASVRTNIEGDDSFEVSMELRENSLCTVDDVVDMISNTDLLSLWCDPVDTLIVTSNSAESNLTHVVDENLRQTMESDSLEVTESSPDLSGMTREYEGEWIEATTSTLESPSSGASLLFNAGRGILESLGLTSYGRITMFIERRRGHIGLTVGPFHGGIHASHSIRVFTDTIGETGGRIKIIDRVRLTHENDGDEGFSLSKLFGCPVDTCVTRCLYPSVFSYVDQVSTSLGRLRILLENCEHTRHRNRSLD